MINWNTLSSKYNIFVSINITKNLKIWKWIKADVCFWICKHLKYFYCGLKMSCQVKGIAQLTDIDAIRRCLFPTDDLRGMALSDYCIVDKC